MNAAVASAYNPFPCSVELLDTGCIVVLALLSPTVFPFRLGPSTPKYKRPLASGRDTFLSVEHFDSRF
jgi:hypothetical protein